MHSVKLHLGWHEYGGAVLNDGVLTSHNLHCVDNNAVHGGCIYNSASLTVNGAFIQHNRASVCGGAVYLINKGTCCIVCCIICHLIQPDPVQVNCGCPKQISKTISTIASQGCTRTRCAPAQLNTSTIQRHSSASPAMPPPSTRAQVVLSLKVCLCHSGRGSSCSVSRSRGGWQEESGGASPTQASPEHRARIHTGLWPRQLYGGHIWTVDRCIDGPVRFDWDQGNGSQMQRQLVPTESGYR